MDEKLDVICQCALAGQKANSGLCKKKHGQEVEGGDSAPLLRSCETPPKVLCSVLGFQAQERHGAITVGPEEGHKNDQSAGTPLL